MNHPRHIRIEEYNYNLPDEKIAKFPLSERDQSKLLLYKKGEISESNFGNLPEYLPESSLMVFNNTRVIQARLHFYKETGACIEIFCLEPVAPADYAMSFQSSGECTWLCMVGNLKKWKSGQLKLDIATDKGVTALFAEKIATKGNTHEIRFTWENSEITFAQILDSVGELPIPPYLNRDTEDSDLETYQTVYSKIEGSVAAPTAGLHFTEKVFEELEKKGIERTELTLHVGAGTFQPVKSELIADHEMHTEFITVERSLIDKLLSERPVIAVGTTSVRTLESLYYIGCLLEFRPNATAEGLMVRQWMPYDQTWTLTVEQSLTNIINYLERQNSDKLVTSTQIMIAPGYQYRIVKGIVTNFHQPTSTLLLLVSAFVGEDWKRIYDYALSHDFRFLSYGDSSLLLP
ncbi:MAG: S-adenosylmethionine:tRNA ribosyltransferase-isomerase [Bacteroidota bacterium]|nr:S-adenosylmethionine:tRNA ribosyltransferase-isomerase [Bacteroidota bacterium]